MAHKGKDLAEARKVAKATKNKSVSLKIGKHKSRSGGLTAAGRAKYNRETGSNQRLLSQKVVLVNVLSVPVCLATKDQ